MYPKRCMLCKRPLDLACWFGIYIGYIFDWEGQFQDTWEGKRLSHFTARSRKRDRSTIQHPLIRTVINTSASIFYYKSQRKFVCFFSMGLGVFLIGEADQGMPIRTHNTKMGSPCSWGCSSGHRPQGRMQSAQGKQSGGMSTWRRRWVGRQKAATSRRRR
jgi:hypothetical protein